MLIYLGSFRSHFFHVLLIHLFFVMALKTFSTCVVFSLCIEVMIFLKVRVLCVAMLIKSVFTLVCSYTAKVRVAACTGGMT